MTEQYTAIDLSARLWAINDGALADVTLEASLAGICVPVALTCDALMECIADLKGYDFPTDFNRRFKVMAALRRALDARGGPLGTLDFLLLVNVGAGRPRPVWLRAVLGVDEDGNAHLTVTPARGHEGEPVPVRPCSRGRAVGDGVLVDATAAANGLGFTVPVALTRGAWGECVAVPETDRGEGEAERLGIVLQMLAIAAKADPEAGPYRRFRVCRDDSPEGVTEVTLVAACGPDDDGSPCVTVMLPDEA